MQHMQCASRKRSSPRRASAVRATGLSQNRTQDTSSGLLCEKLSINSVKDDTKDFVHKCFIMNSPLLLDLSVFICQLTVNIKSLIQFNYICCSMFEVPFNLFIKIINFTLSSTITWNSMVVHDATARKHLELIPILLLLSYWYIIILHLTSSWDKKFPLLSEYQHFPWEVTLSRKMLSCNRPALIWTMHLNNEEVFVNSFWRSWK